MPNDPEARASGNTGILIGVIALIIVVGLAFAFISQRNGNDSTSPTTIINPPSTTVVNPPPASPPSTTVITPPATSDDSTSDSTADSQPSGDTSKGASPEANGS